MSGSHMKVLLFHVNIFKQNSIIQLCQDLGVDSYVVKEDDLTKTIGQIAGSSVSKSSVSRPVPFKDEMLVFCGLEPGQLDVFLEEFKKRDIAPVSLKAVMTPFNAQWTPGRLWAELRKEQEYINSKE